MCKPHQQRPSGIPDLDDILHDIGPVERPILDGTTQTDVEWFFILYAKTAGRIDLEMPYPSPFGPIHRTVGDVKRLPLL